jgi:hypothetical protein
MSSLHSGSRDVAAEYVHVWNTIYKDGYDKEDDQK